MSGSEKNNMRFEVGGKFSKHLSVSNTRSTDGALLRNKFDSSLSHPDGLLATEVELRVALTYAVSARIIGAITDHKLKLSVVRCGANQKDVSITELDENDLQLIPAIDPRIKDRTTAMSVGDSFSSLFLASFLSLLPKHIYIYISKKIKTVKAGKSNTKHLYYYMHAKCVNIPKA